MAKFPAPNLPFGSAGAGVPVQVFPTPNLADVLFYTDDKLETPGNKGPYALGDASPDAVRWPNHKLVHQVEQVQADGRWIRRFWINDRTNQDAYNYEITYPYGGNTSYPRYTRTYVYPRATYTPVAKGTADPVHAGAFLISEVQTRSGEREIDNLYVIVTRTYDTIPRTADIGSSGAMTGFGYSVSYPEQDVSYPVVTWTFQIKASDYAAAAFGSACPIPAYNTLELVSQETTGATDQNQMITVTRIYRQVPGRVLDGRAYVGEFGGEVVHTHSQLVTTASTFLEPNFRTVSKRRTPQGAYTSVEEVVELPDTTTWPTLVEDIYDQTYDGIIRVEKTVVAPSGQSGSVVDGVLTEYKDIDKWHRVQIVSRVPSDITERTDEIPVSQNFAWPDILTDVKIKYVAAYSPFGPSGLGLMLDANIVEPRVGVSPGRLVRTFHYSPPPVPVGVFEAYPEAHTIYALIYRSSTVGITGVSEVQTWGIRPTIHEEITVSYDYLFTPEDEDIEVPSAQVLAATTPDSLDDGEYLVGYDCRPWRCGVWVLEKLYLTYSE